MFGDELTGLEEHLRDQGGAFGDARRCPIHPGVKTSSDDGLFDAPCDRCEYEMDLACGAWDEDPENPKRHYCRPTGWFPSATMFGKQCQEDEIPF